jgi:hypothetical protein
MDLVSFLKSVVVRANSSLSLTLSTSHHEARGIYTPKKNLIASRQKSTYPAWGLMSMLSISSHNTDKVDNWVDIQDIDMHSRPAAGRD